MRYKLFIDRGYSVLNEPTKLCRFWAAVEHVEHIIVFPYAEETALSPTQLKFAGQASKITTSSNK